MAWHRDAISDGEIDALRRVALAACNDDTRYPAWRGRTGNAGGHCYCIARWLVQRLGGHIGANHGHYVWLSPDDRYVLDLSNAHRNGERAVYAGNTAYRRVGTVDNERTLRFSRRADRLFERLDVLVRLGLDYGGDAYPAEEPQRADDLDRFDESWTDPEQYWHDEPEPTTPEGLYQFVYANGQLEVSPNHSHDQLAEHAGIAPDSHSGPFAAGHVVVSNGQATWEVQANVNLHALFRILKDASKNYGWQWGGMTDANGQPITEDFAPKKTGQILHYVHLADHLYLGRTSAADLAVGANTEDTELVSGIVRIIDGRAEVTPVHIGALPHLFEWAQDAGLTLYAGNDNVIKTIPDLQEGDNYNPQTLESPNPAEPPVVDERLPTGLYRCPACDQLFPNWHEYQKHRRDQESWGDPDRSSPNSDYGLPKPDPGLFGDGAHFHERRSEPGITTGRVAAQTYYHVAPTADRDRVRTHGLQPSDPRQNWERTHPDAPNGIYAYPTLAEARDYADELTGKRDAGHDIWEIPNTGPWRPDPENADAFTRSYCYVGNAPIMNARLAVPEEDDDGYWQPRDRAMDYQISNDLGYDFDPKTYRGQLRKGNPWGIGRPDRVLGRVVVLPARTWGEAARVDGFSRYAKAFDYANDDWQFYVAYRNGDPLGYAVLSKTGGIQMVHCAVENQGIGSALYTTLMTHYAALHTHAAHEKTAAMLQHRGWVQSSGQLWRWAKDQAATDLLDGPVPFIYDVQEDKIHVGHPGARTSDIPGRFTPGGIVEGNYEPGGKVVVRSLTSIPYTVRHMIELWYYTHPQLEVKSVHLQDDQGKDTRLASVDISTVVRTAVAADPAVQTAANTLMMAGGQVFAVGGAVRDAVMGKEPHDIDLMVTGLRSEKVAHLLESLPGKVAHEGKSFAVFHYRFKGHTVEIALPRRERSTGTGHQDFDVQSDHTMTPEEDFQRRDFTVNAMGVDLATGTLVDPFNGQQDIANSTLRTLNDKSLTEDPLRVVRAIVANARHGLQPDEATRAQMSDNAHMLQHLPSERIQAELDKLMASEQPARAIRLAHETGVLKYILPEVDAAFGFDQNNPHHEHELGDHLLRVLDRASARTTDPDVRLAALLHDIGKPESAWQDPDTGFNHYYQHHLPDGTILGKDHDSHGAKLARARMHHLHYPTERINRVSDLIQHHMWPAFTTNRGARRFLQRVGDHADDLMDLRWADRGGKDLYPTDPTLSLNVQRRLIDRARNAGEATNQAQLAINGHDLIAAGIPPGPQMGQILRDLTDKVVDDPTLNNRGALLQQAAESAKLGADHGHHQTFEDRRPEEGTGRRQAHAPQDEGHDARPVNASLPSLHTQDEQSPPLRRYASEEPRFPTADEAIGLNQEAYALYHELFGDDPTWGGVLKPNELESALNSAKQHYYYGPEEDDGERLSQGLAKMAYKIAGSQVFGNANKRTAIWLLRHYLDQNGLGHMSPMDHDDYELADHLIEQDSYGKDPPPGMSTEDLNTYLQQQRSQLEGNYLNMWRERYNQGAPNPAYEQRYPEGTYLIDPAEAAANPPQVPER